MILLRSSSYGGQGDETGDLGPADVLREFPSIPSISSIPSIPSISGKFAERGSAVRYEAGLTPDEARHPPSPRLRRTSWSMKRRLNGGMMRNTATFVGPTFAKATAGMQPRKL